MSTGSRPPRPRALFVAALLLLTLVLAGVLALQAHRTFLDHRATAERVLRDNARLAAARFAQRVGMELYYSTFWPTVEALSHAKAGAPGTPLPSPTKLAVGLDSAAAHFLKRARYSFRFDLATRRLETAGGAPAPQGDSPANGGPGSGPQPQPQPQPTPPSGGGAAPFPSSSHPCGVTSTAPAWQHVVWIVMENKAASQVMGSSGAPYLNGLAGACGAATSFFAESHPSLPNYIAMTSGSTQGITDDAAPSSHQLGVPSIFSQLGGDWRALQESMPANCAKANSGSYAVRHNPAAYYTNIASACAMQDVPLGATPDISARFTFITPNLCSDMHDCSVSQGDGWLAGWVPRILDSPEYRSGTTAVFITFDEDDHSANNHIATVVVAPSTPAGTVDATRYDHYSLLRTTEEMLGLMPLGSAMSAPSMRGGMHL